ALVLPSCLDWCCLWDRMSTESSMSMGESACSNCRNPPATCRSGSGTRYGGWQLRARRSDRTSPARTDVFVEIPASHASDGVSLWSRGSQTSQPAPGSLELRFPMPVDNFLEIVIASHSGP